MRMTILGIFALFAGFSLLIINGFSAGIILVFPFIVASGPLAILGIFLIFIGSILVFLGFLEGSGHTLVEGGEKRGIGVVLIGPIPLIIDTENRKLSLISLIIFIVALILLILYLGALA